MIFKVYMGIGAVCFLVQVAIWMAALTKLCASYVFLN